MVSLGTNLPHGAGRPGQWFDAIATSPRPAVVDYAADGDRVELSGRVLANWAAKTANLLDAEGYGPGSTIVLDLPLGWKSLALLLGAARAGVDVLFSAAPASAQASGPDPVDLIVSGTPGTWADHPAELWAVAAGAPGAAQDAAEEEPPSHALDYATEVPMQADQCHLPLPGPGLPAIVAAWADHPAAGAGDAPDGGTADGQGSGTDAGAPVPRWSHRERGLVVAAEGRLDREVARAVVGMWDRGYPVVLVPERDADVSGATARIVEAERLGAAVDGRS